MPKKRVIVTKSACKTNKHQPKKKKQHLQNDHALYRVIC